MAALNGYSVTPTHQGEYVTTAEARPTARVLLFAKFVRLQFGAFACLYELITGDKPPKAQDLLRMQ